MKIEEVLFKLDDFCAANKIEYTVTGTVALTMLGIPSNPNDIDIKVFHLKEDQKARLKELQFMSCLDKENYSDTCYSDTCYSFLVGGIKINAIVDNTESYDEILSQGVMLELIDKAQAKRRLISVQLVLPALGDKMKLKRDKDKTYMLNLINMLSRL